MGSVPKNSCGTADKGLAELNHHMRYEHKEVRDGVVGEGQGLSEEDESRINEIAEDVNEGCEEAAKPQVGLQKQQQQPQGPVVRWERFLPLRSLKVLLVENDDSTRQVVSALLRNCSYEVTAAANGLQAWKILQDLTNHIDLVLTEVVMPCLNGIGLLTKIMNHKTCKNIPVIMMSSHDSMGIVFRCLSKGAVDFLVKPIRKNELKNLWQHVWRRCHSSSGSGSESGIQTQKSAKSNSVDESDNNSGSNDEDEDDDESTGLNLRDGSDNGSGTQSSWTKRAVEVDSPQPMSPWDQLADPPDSTCAQVPKPEAFGCEWQCRASKKQLQEQHEKLREIVVVKDLEIGGPRNNEIHQEYSPEKVCTNLIGTMKDDLPASKLDKDNEQVDKESLKLNMEKTMEEVKAQTTIHVGLVTSSTNMKSETKLFEAPNCLCNVSEIKDKTIDAKELPSLELSLKRLRGIGDVSAAANDDRNVLRHSDLSAFSRYSAPSTANLAPTGNVGSCSPLDNSSEAMKTDSMHNQRSNGSSNNNDMGSTTRNVFTKPASFDEKALTSTARCLHPSAFQPIQNSRISTSQVMTQKNDDAVINELTVQPRGANQQVQVQHHHHHYHHHHHHVHNMQQKQPQLDHDDISMNMEEPALQCGSSNVFGVAIESNAGNYSLNGSASGSNHGSNKHNGSSQDINAGAVNVESDNGMVGKSRVGGGSGSGSGMDQNRFAQRVAALTKFRQKRKERCFEKKVRYQSRKRLAEQRPRVRGQFVRQRVCDSACREADC